MQAPYFPSLVPAQQPLRVRLSCDSCSEAKVKCDKRRPACERCSSNQLHCIYSVSRRHGCKRKVASEPAITAHDTANISGQSSREGPGGDSASATKSQDRDTIGFSTYDSIELSGSNTANESITFHDGNDFSEPFQCLADDEITMSADVNGSAFAFDSSPTTSDSPFQSAHRLRRQQEPGQTPWTPFAAPSTKSIHGQNLRVSGYSAALPAAFKALSGAFDRTTGRPREVHNCEAYALTLLRSLHHWPLYSPDKDSQITSSNQACAFPEIYPADGDANPEVLHSLDTILHANKCALSGILKLFECSCARRPHLATLYMSIITKMLSLYEIAATMDMSSPDCPSSASPIDATYDLYGPRLSRTSAIQVGVFDLDEEDQATLQRGIILRQLRKMEEAIENFAPLDDGDLMDHDISLKQWHSLAISMIKKDLQRIYQNCKEKLLIMA